jgi:hypothetical protein
MFPFAKNPSTVSNNQEELPRNQEEMIPLNELKSTLTELATGTECKKIKRL